MHGEQDRSAAPRVALAAWHVAGVALATYWLGRDGVGARDLALLVCAWVYFARLLLTSFYLLKRKVGWAEAAQVGPFVFVMQVGLAYLGGRSDAPPGRSDVVALGLYALGSFLNTYSELQRKWWKARPENRGRLYTRGLFSLSMHVNYFGDVVLFSGFAMLTRNPWAFVLPALMAAGFLFVHIPTLDGYLKHRYGEEFREWERRTSRFIPFLY